MKRRYDKRARAFTCALTGVRLSDEPLSPLRPTWEHLTPGDASTADLAAAIFNHMKSDLSENQFQEVVKELARVFTDRSKEFDRSVLPSVWRPKALT